jgi:hypothetical protein
MGHITHVFIVAPELTRAAVFADAKVDGTIVLLELPRYDTAPASIAVFLDTVQKLIDLRNHDGAVTMPGVGVVMRHMNGERVVCDGKCPTLIVTLNKADRVMAMLGPHVAIRTAVTPQGAAASGC